jgi:O-antigen/teichoic acid export membrane protein
MTGNQRIFLLVILVSTVVSLAGSAALVPRYGATGAAVATVTAVVLFNTASVLFVRRLWGVWPYNRQYLKPMLAGGLAAAVVLIVRPVLSLPQGPYAMLVLGPLFMLGYTASMLALGLNRTDKQFLRSVWAALGRNVPGDAGT